MAGLVLPRHVAVAEKKRRQEEGVATSIQKTAMNALNSDDWATRKHVQSQLDELASYLAARREDEAEYMLPQPVGWKIMILVMAPPQQSDGGVILVDESREGRALASPQGVVLAVGPAAYRSSPERFTVDGELLPWCGTGDRLMNVKYDANTFTLANGQMIGFLNDTQPVGLIDTGWEVPK